MIAGSGPAISTVERQQLLLVYIEQQQRVSVAQICGRFGVSAATARRDLETLDSLGKIRRVHGAALAILQAPPELPVLQRRNEHQAEKARIGEAVARLIQDGETVFLGSGTTVLEVMPHLQVRKDLTIITNSLLVMNAVVDKPGISIVGLGGYFRRSELSLIGHITEQALAELRADRVVLGIRALDVQAGLTSDYLPETMTDRAILGIGRQVILAADHSKLGRTSTAFLAHLNAVHILVTDSAAPAEVVGEIRERGVRVILA